MDSGVESSPEGFARGMDFRGGSRQGNVLGMTASWVDRFLGADVESRARACCNCAARRVSISRQLHTILALATSRGPVSEDCRESTATEGNSFSGKRPESGSESEVLLGRIFKVSKG